jgi:hypothetical protein
MKSCDQFAKKTRNASQELAECTYMPAQSLAACVLVLFIGQGSDALSEHDLLGLAGFHPENPTFALPCREVCTRGQRKIGVVGPSLEDEAAEPHRGFW